jgi:hypothetical protein
LPRLIRKLQHGSKDSADAGSIFIAYVADWDALEQCHPFLPVQVKAENVFEQFEPLKHHGGRQPERSRQLRLDL